MRRTTLDLSIETEPNWGDFKAFTTLRRAEATFLSSDAKTRRLTIDLDGKRIVLGVGGPVVRFASQLRARVEGPVPFVRWFNILVVGLPNRSGHALFRAAEERQPPR